MLAGLAGLALAASAASRIRRGFLLAVVVIGLAWATLDIREVHQLDESRTRRCGRARVAALRLAVAAISGPLATQEPATSLRAVSATGPRRSDCTP